ncbi:MAG: hypothetical protein AAFZ09_00305 [Pseudomonadota bacterium]
MAFSLDEFFRDSGTRFLLHPQAPMLEDFREPEPVWVSSPRGSLAPGPADDRMYAIDPIDKKPYDETSLPPYRGPVHPPARPGPDGHFDHITPGRPGFRAAHMFGAIRRVLDIWEVYAGGPLPWHFDYAFDRLELVTKVSFRNAHFGTGFCECGDEVDDQGNVHPFALNFDVLAHETGHGLVFSMVGMPGEDTLSTDFLGFHESASDLVALLSALHFESFIRHVLRRTGGDLYVANEMNRIGELSGTKQIRIASNPRRLSDLAYRAKAPMDLTGKEVHTLGQPMTGAIFDIIVVLFLRRLVETGAVPAHLAEAARRSVDGTLPTEAERGATRGLYESNPGPFHDALRDARDMVGLRLAATWHRLRPHHLRFETVAASFMAVDRSLTGARYQDAIRACFAWRGIDPSENPAQG